MAKLAISIKENGWVVNPAEFTIMNSHVKKSAIVNFGCRLNISEGAHIDAQLKQAGRDDILVVNSCAVTQQATRKSLQAARKLKRDNPDKKVIFTGCGAQINPQKYQNIAEIDAVIGNHDKMNLSKYLESETEMGTDNLVSNIFDITETALHLSESYRQNQTRAFVQIQNGCDHRCTFCIIPYGRGNSRSVAPDAICKQINALIDADYKEIVLTGVDLTSYHYVDNSGKNWQLGQLVQEILTKCANLPRLRLSSLDCIEIDDALIEVMPEPRLMPHLHLSLQSGDDLILKRMKRRHLRDDAVELCANLRAIRPDLQFGADFIAGFPTETDAHFDNSCALIEECDLTWLHVFPFSPRADDSLRRECHNCHEQLFKPARQKCARLVPYGRKNINKILSVKFCQF